VTTLGEVAEFEMGQAPPGSECNTDGIGTLFVKAGEFGEQTPMQREWTTKPLKFGRAGDVFICVVGATAGKLNLGIDCAIGRSVAAIRPSSTLDTRFLYYQLQPWVLKLRAASAGSAQGVITKRQLAEIPVDVPPPDEQRRIVAELEKQFSRLDEAIANLKRVKANLKRYKSAVLKAAVEGGLVPTEAELAGSQRRSYETADQLLERIAATVARSVRAAKRSQPSSESGSGLLFDLPEGWSVAPIAHLAEVVEYGSSAKTSEADAGVPVLRMGNIVDGNLDLSTLKYLPDSHEEFPRLLLRPGDLLFNRTNSPELVGKTAVFNGRPEKCSFASYLIRVRLASGCMPEFVSAFINSAHGRRWVKAVATQQVGQANVNGTKLQNLLIPLPPIVEQERIVSELGRRLSVVGHVAASIDAKLQQAATLREATLHSQFGAPVTTCRDGGPNE
jgi:type I restriction enzyme S subunit